MFSNRKLQTAVRLGLGISVGAVSVGFAPGAIAQELADGPIEEIITTGSRIKRADLDSASPVTVLDRDAMTVQGITDVGSLLQRMPSMSGTPLGTTTNNGNTSTGSVQVDLRGMGPDRTLTLVNGKRTVDGGDYTTIPSIMIERVEILKDGASAVYGADAVAGVVNIITRSDFEGVNIDLLNADWFDTDNGQQQSLSIIAGKNFDGGHFVFGAEYVDQEEAFQRDTPWDFMQGSYYVYYDTDEGCEKTPTTCTFFGSSRIPESRIQYSSTGGFETLVDDRPADPLADPPITFKQNNFIGMIPSAGAVMDAYDGRSYNYAPINYMQTPYDRFNYFGEGAFDVSPSVQFTASVRGTDRNSDQELAPLPYDTNIYPSYAGSFDTDGDPSTLEAYNGVSEQQYYNMLNIDNYNATNGTTFGYEPATNIRRRMVERPRHYTQDLTQFQTVLGFNGTIGDEMDWDVYYNRGKRTVNNNNTGQFSGVRLTGALGPSEDTDGDGIPECYGTLGDPSTLIVGCVPLNLFAGEGAVTDEMYDWVAVETMDSRITKQEIWGASITGSAFELPGGALGWAVGAGYKKEEYKFTPDSAKAIGAVTGGTTEGTDGSLDSKAVFMELYAPLYDNGTQSLALTGGTRYDDYDLFGDDTTWQVGLEFQAIDSLKLRGTAGTAFRAPSISELFAGLGRSAPSYFDPCDASDYASNFGGNGSNFAPGCAQEANRTDTQTTSLVGGNLDLVPETADTYTAGFVFTPEIGGNAVSLTVDWWRIEMDKAISSYGVQYILDQCYVSGAQDQCAEIFRRTDADYTIRHIIDGNVNVATQTGEGIDTELRYGFSTSFGEFESAILWSHLIEREKTALPGDPAEDLRGRHTNTTAEDGGTYAKDKVNTSLRYHRGALSVSLLGEYISGIDATATYNTTYTYGVDSFFYTDLVIDYTFDIMGETRLTAGITNLSDEAPPYIDPGFNANTDPNTYRVFGRGWYVRLSQTF